MISLRGISRSFGRGPTRVVALRGVDLDLRRGHLVGLFGNNGAGKTTLLRILAGLLDPDDEAEGGQVWFAGERASGAWRPRGLDVGYAGADDRTFYPRLTVRENLVFHGTLRGMERGPARAAAGEWAARLSIEPSLERPFQVLSSGQRQRVNLVRALMHAPSVLLLDEPTRSLDPGASRLVLDLARERADAGVLVVLSSHELSGVEPRCDDIILLDHGRVLLAGPREEVLPRADHPTWRVLFHGEAARDRAVAASLGLRPDDVAEAALLAPGSGERAVGELLDRDDLELAAVERLDRPSVSDLLRSLPAPDAGLPVATAVSTAVSTQAEGSAAVPEARRSSRFHALRALVRRDRLVHLTFKFRLLVQATMICVWAALYHYIAQIIGSDDAGVQGALRGNPFGFLLIGLVALQLSQVALIQMAQGLREEQIAGTLEPLLASGRSPLLLVLGSLIWPLGFALVLVVGMFAFTSLVLDAGFYFSAALPAVVAAALGCGAFAALGLISASFVLAFKRGDPVGGVLNMAGLIFAGAYFPRELLPQAAQHVAQVLPHTHLLTALRATLLDGAGFGDPEYLGALARLAISVAVLVVLAVATWNRALRHARRTGTLTDA